MRLKQIFSIRNQQAQIIYTFKKIQKLKFNSSLLGRHLCVCVSLIDYYYDLFQL